MRQPTALEAILRRDRVLVLAGLGAVVALAWASMVRLGAGMEVMRGMADEVAMPLMHPWGPTDLTLTFVMWVVMMIAMMVPTAAPVVIGAATAKRRRRETRQPFVWTGVFLLGYCVVWAGFAAMATGGQWALHEAAQLSPMRGAVTPVLGGTILVAAGVFQWTPWKHACLRGCRTPIGFLMTEWREGTRGALEMGVKHGSLCLGCCWALMGLMFVGGTMQLVWMAGVAAYVLVEKVVPAGHRISKVAGALLVAWGLWTLAQPLGLL